MGVLVPGPAIAKARNDLYYLERACGVRRLAESTGRPLVPEPREIAAATVQRMRHESLRDSPKLHLDSIKRQLDHDAPEYRQ